ncbi:MAG: hypothetical protein RI973_1302 [Bacteroidota bacterium]|jgi:AraC-like DNA-binding protein
MRLSKQCLSFLILAFLCPNRNHAQLLDTSLIQFHASPYFFNVIKAADGQIYAGTSDGILQLRGFEMKHVDDREGYLTLDANGILAIDTNGIQYHDQREYLHLLPFPSESRVEYHAGDKDFFYIAAGGKMHIYKILPYAYRYRNQSVRTISPNFVGTYSGVYYKGKRLSFPSFTDGYIREYHGKAFVCYSWLAIYKMGKADTLPANSFIPQPEGFDYRQVRDLRYSLPFNRYFVSTITQLGSIDTALTRASTLFTVQHPEEDVVLLGDDRKSFLFAAGNRLFRCIGDEIQTIVELPEAIKDGIPTHLSHYLLTSKALYAYRSNEKLEKLVELQNAHTLLLLPGSELVIGTDNGLYRYNIVSRMLTVLINGVEFNRRALHLQEGLLYAGAVNGLYVLDIKTLDDIVASAKESPEGYQLPTYFKLILAALSLLSILLAHFWWRTRNKVAQLVEESSLSIEVQKEEVILPDKVQIEDFVREHIKLVTLKAIQVHFNISARVLYTILEPEKPGAIIQRIRLERVRELKKEGMGAKEIAEESGLSESYVRQIWSEKD